MSVTVRDDTGVGVPNAIVSLSPRAMIATGQKTAVLPAIGNNGVHTKSDGTALFANIPAGAYAVCAQDLSFSLVDSCVWVPNPSTALVKSGQTTPVVLDLKLGAQVVVLLSDPTSVLAVAPSSPPPYICGCLSLANRSRCR